MASCCYLHRLGRGGLGGVGGYEPIGKSANTNASLNQASMTLLGRLGSVGRVLQGSAEPCRGVATSGYSSAKQGYDYPFERPLNASGFYLLEGCGLYSTYSTYSTHNSRLRVTESRVCRGHSTLSL